MMCIEQSIQAKKGSYKPGICMMTDRRAFFINTEMPWWLVHLSEQGSVTDTTGAWRGTDCKYFLYCDDLETTEVANCVFIEKCLKGSLCSLVKVVSHEIVVSKGNDKYGMGNVVKELFFVHDMGQIIQQSLVELGPIEAPVLKL